MAGSAWFCIDSGIAVDEVIDYNLPVNKKVALSGLSVRKQSRSRELSEDGHLPIFFLFLGLCGTDCARIAAQSSQLKLASDTNRELPCCCGI
jgi:hypothetical protein